MTLSKGSKEGFVFQCFGENPLTLLLGFSTVHPQTSAHLRGTDSRAALSLRPKVPAGTKEEKAGTRVGFGTGDPVSPLASR